MNTYRKISIGVWIVMLIFIISMFYPSLYAEDSLMEWGFAVTFLCLFLSISALFTAILLGKYAKKFDQINKSKNNLVHWKYSDEEWKNYTETEHIIDASGKKILFL